LFCMKRDKARGKLISRKLRLEPFDGPGLPKRLVVESAVYQGRGRSFFNNSQGPHTCAGLIA
jgi:hypothetical protein